VARENSQFLVTAATSIAEVFLSQRVERSDLNDSQIVESNKFTKCASFLASRILFRYSIELLTVEKGDHGADL